MVQQKYEPKHPVFKHSPKVLCAAVCPGDIEAARPAGSPVNAHDPDLQLLLPESQQLLPALLGGEPLLQLWIQHNSRDLANWSWLVLPIFFKFARAQGVAEIDCEEVRAACMGKRNI